MSARIEIYPGAFKHNVRTLQAFAPGTQTLLALKADGYGLGLQQMAAAAVEAGANWLGVLEIHAGLELRKAGFTLPLLAWLHSTRVDFAAAIAAKIDLGVSSVAELERIAAASSHNPANVHLKVDTGLHRNGCSLKDWPDLVKKALLFQQQGILRITGIWSHLADASEADDRAALSQFLEAISVAHSLGVPSSGAEAPLIHLAASSAGITLKDAHFDLVRWGIAAFGVTPLSDRSAEDLGLQQPVRLIAEVSAVSENSVFLDVGWADGIPALTAAQIATHSPTLSVAGLRLSITAVHSDSIELNNVSGANQPHIGQEVIVYGDSGEPGIADWAQWGDTIGDEILTNLSRRIPRSYH